ncbi:hypothetical protein [Pontixanthobacter rizhaonensis]|uniref:hypothetical protein n=1 Tax=Pontixanthobacter rizhaonensis TaxID=2730337 RepID=UPI001FE488F4|nr:hypothetical protein [Pontixanthobacter rizhaonensis]
MTIVDAVLPSIHPPLNAAVTAFSRPLSNILALSVALARIYTVLAALGPLAALRRHDGIAAHVALTITGSLTALSNSLSLAAILLSSLLPLTAILLSGLLALAAIGLARLLAITIAAFRALGLSRSGIRWGRGCDHCHRQSES